MATELPRPGVEVIQEFEAASPTLVQPTLVPFITGVAKEIIEVTNSDGTVNADAKQGPYDQLPQVVSQSAFPSPRGNITEVDVEEASVRAFLLSGGSLDELERDPGEAFLTSHNEARRASIRSQEEDAGFDLDAKTLVIAIDQTARLNTTDDIVITFVETSGDLTSIEVAAQINIAVGKTVATVEGSGATSRVQITSLTFGATSSVTIRAGGSANTVLKLADASEERVEASGFRAQDDNDNDTVAPWIEFSRGDYLLAGVSTSWPTGAGATDPEFGQVDEDGVFAEALTPALLFTGGSSIDLKVGDYYVADGTRLSSGEVERVEASRFRIGVLNTALSTFDSEGKLLTPVRDVVEQNTILSSTPFAPRHSWFRARGLDGTETPTSAILTGTTSGAPAETAVVTGTADLVSANGPFALTGLTLKVVVTKDDVVEDEQVVTFTASLADTDAIVAAIIAAGVTDFTAVTFDAGGGVENLRLSTLKTGNGQAIKVVSTGSANVTIGFSDSVDTNGTGKDVEFVDVAAAVQTSGNAYPETGIAIAETLEFELSTDGGDTFPTVFTFTYTAAPGYANVAAIVSDLQDETNGAWAPSNPVPGTVLLSANGDELVATTVATGSNSAIRIGVGSTALGVGTLGINYTSGQEDVGEENLAAQTLQFKLNDRNFVYEVVFATDSLEDAVEVINDVADFTIASASSDKIVLTSTLKGAASKVEVLDNDTTAKALAALGYGTGNQVATGTGRPNSDFSLDINGNAVVGAEILRNQVTGDPSSPGVADLYIQYIALRKDVTSAAANPALINIGDTTTLGTVLGPITSANPLGLGMLFALVNAPGINVAALGVDEASAAAPQGTLAGFTRVADFIESEEIYAIAPLTHDDSVIQMFNTHVVFMSSAGQKGERIVIVNSLNPDRAVSAVVASGLSADTTATDNELQLDVDPTAALVAAGVNPALPIPATDNVFVEVTVAGSVRKYSVSDVNSTLVTFRTTFAAGENDDNFYTTVTLTETLINADWSMKIRGNKLLIAGSTLPDNQAIAETVQAQAEAFKSRRLVYTFPDTVVASVSGLEETLPGYFMAAAIAGMVGRQPPQQGFTNFPMTGFTGVQGSNDTFSNSQMNIMAAGGTYVVIQDADGTPLISRHQLTTDLTSVETRELSITKVVDFTAKFLRAGLRNFIGTFNITQPFLDTLSSVIQGQLAFLVESGVLVGADLNNIIQSTDSPDMVLVDVTLDVPFPSNYIRLTLVV